MSKYYGLKLDWKERLFGIKCPNCKERSRMHSDEYVRGYNNLCSQASGSKGLFCMKCASIIYLIPVEEYRRIMPSWCTVFPDDERARFYPGFKHNRDTSRVSTHSTNLK